MILYLPSYKSQDKMKIVYVYDALCGWCYGFSPVMNRFHEKYKDSVDFEVISGGMITGARIGPIGKVAAYIKWAYKDVENTTGIKFGDVFLNNTLKNGKAIFTSVPTAIALSIFKTLDHKNSILFAFELQKAIYFNGVEPTNTNYYGTIAERFNVDSKDFMLKMRDSLYLESAEMDFKKTVNLGVKGFPSVFVEIDGKYYNIANGYVTFTVLENNFLEIKNKQ